MVTTIGKLKCFLIEDACHAFGSEYKYDWGNFENRGSYNASTKGHMKNLGLFSNLGYNEVVLSGIHLSSYGNDIDSNLLELLKLIETYCQITNIRLSSIDPADTSKELIVNS